MILTPNTTELGFEQSHKLSHIFGNDGTLSHSLPFFNPRPEQNEMAVAVTHAINNTQCAILEAGTGTGKTYAYLVPTLLWGGKSIISTGTKTLQDQLFERDLPTIRDALGAPVSIALLKGRANYVCHYHLDRTLMNGRLLGRDDANHIKRIKQDLNRVKRGDKAEWPDIPDDAMVWNQVTSTRENCLGSDCPNHKECFVMAARKDAQAADVIVVNHHLFFADVMLREEGIAELLPAVNTVVFDEAHQVPEVASIFFGQQVSTAQFIDWARDIQAEGITHARDAADWREVKDVLERAAKDVRIACGDTNGRWSVEQIATDAPLWAAIEQLAQTIAQTSALLAPITQRAETIEQLATRLEELSEQLTHWRQLNSTDMVRWVEAFSHTVRFNATPLSVAEPFTRQRETEHPRTWIFTSATLSVRGDFSLFQQQLGLLDAHTASWDSPFNFPEQGLLYVPNDLPEPWDKQFTNIVLKKIFPLLRASDGRAFILCTTLSAVKRYGAWLGEQIEQHQLNWTLLIQGEHSRTELLNRYREASNPVLVGSQSFWEGVDVRGDALSLVIIDKLPFAPPDDPVLAARLRVMEERGENGFMNYQIPQAVINLKQGAGRLIRSEKDRGVLMICDSRLITKRYGGKIWQSLPPFARTREETVACGFFSHLPKNAP